MKDLKECPFCGAAAAIYNDGHDVYVQCKSCRIRTAIMPIFRTSTGIADGEEVVAKVWNRRVSNFNDKPQSKKAVPELQNPGYAEAHFSGGSGQGVHIHIHLHEMQG